MPLTTALIGERVEVCFGTEYDDGNGETYNGLFWFGGEIIKLGGREHGARRAEGNHRHQVRRRHD